MDLREGLAESLPGTHERPAGAEAGDQGVDPRQRLGDLCARALVVGARVRLVRVLVEHEVAGVALRQVQREANGAVRPLGRRREDELRAVELQELDPLRRGVLREDAGQAVTLQLRDHCERDSRVAARGLEQLASRLELARASAASTMVFAIRSLIEPVGFWPSSFA